MKILYVEDKDDFAAEFASFIKARIGTELDIVESSSEAERAIAGASYDVVIVDLAIPAERGGEPHVDIGAAFCRKVASDCSSAVIIVFTGQYDERQTHELRDDLRRSVQYCGGAERPILSRKRKDNIESILQVLEEMSREEEEAGNITLSSFTNRGLGDECSEQDRRLIRSFSVSRGASAARVEKLSGGLSGSAVYRVDVVSGSVVTQRCVAKMDDGVGVDQEVARYDRYVSQLPNGSCVQKINIDVVAGGARRGVFYSLAEGFDANLFCHLAGGGQLISQVRANLARWHDDRETTRSSLRDMVVRVGGQRALARLEELGVEGLSEALVTEIVFEESTQHGDLHGANVLCNESGDASCFIDFGDVGRMPACLDVVTLELSPFFHPSFEDSEYAALKQSPAEWFNDKAVIGHAGESSWISSTRTWSSDIALSHVDYAATVLAYAARQLKYEDTDHVFAVGIVRAAMLQLLDR